MNKAESEIPRDDSKTHAILGWILVLIGILGLVWGLISYMSAPTMYKDLHRSNATFYIVVSGIMLLVGVIILIVNYAK